MHRPLSDDLLQADTKEDITHLTMCFLKPKVGNMELCVRLVNGRDGDMQTLAKPDPTSKNHYKYPVMVGC